MGSPQTGDTANEDAKKLISATTHGMSADCIFQTWPHDRQMAAYRELNHVQDAPGDNVPHLMLSFDNSGTHLVRQDGQPEGACVVPTPEISAAEKSLPKVHIAHIASERSAPSESAYESERLEHPERAATKIEDTSLLALNDNEQARLDLRVQLENLMHEPNKEYRDNVLKKMEEDGSYGLTKLTSERPHVVVSADSSGTPESVEFSKNLGIDKQTIPLNKSVADQVDDAQKGYVHGLNQIVGGLGKFDPDSTVKAMDILDGAEPSNLRWFMLYRKQQGRPAVDPPQPE